MGCPQTEREFQKYFSELTGRAFDSPANDFEAVMAARYDWNGQMMQIPMNVPLAGRQLPSDAPFYGLTQQVKGGVSAGRIWIPAAVPQVDENGNEWYTRYIQIIKDKPGGTPKVDFLWTWWYQGGNEYVPICTDGGTVPPVDNLLQRIETLESQVANHEGRIATLESKQTSRIPKKIALIADNRKYVTAEVTANPPILVARGDNSDAWQQFEVVVLEWEE